MQFHCFEKFLILGNADYSKFINWDKEQKYLSLSFNQVIYNSRSFYIKNSNSSSSNRRNKDSSSHSSSSSNSQSSRGSRKRSCDHGTDKSLA